MVAAASCQRQKRHQATGSIEFSDAKPRLDVFEKLSLAQCYCRSVYFECLTAVQIAPPCGGHVKKASKSICSSASMSGVRVYDGHNLRNEDLRSHRGLRTKVQFRFEATARTPAELRESR